MVDPSYLHVYHFWQTHLCLDRLNPFTFKFLIMLSIKIHVIVLIIYLNRFELILSDQNHLVFRTIDLYCIFLKKCLIHF